MDSQKQNLAEEITALQERIAHWRAERTKQGPMYLPLWEEATQLAEAHGVGRLAKILNLNFSKLHSLTNKTLSQGLSKVARQPLHHQPDPVHHSLTASLAGFEDIGPPLSMPKEDFRMAIELILPDSARFKIQHRGGSSEDIKTLMGTF